MVALRPQCPPSHLHFYSTSYSKVSMTPLCYDNWQNPGMSCTYDYSFIIKTISQEQSNRRDTEDDVWRFRVSMPFPGTPPTWHINMFIILQVLWASVLPSFHWGFITEAWLTNHWSHDWTLPPDLSFPQRLRGGVKISHSLILFGVSVASPKSEAT